MKYQGPTDLSVRYRNHRGEVAVRRVKIGQLRWGASQWHPDPQWLLGVWDEDKGEPRTFALRDCDFLSARAQRNEAA